MIRDGYATSGRKYIRYAIYLLPLPIIFFAVFLSFDWWIKNDLEPIVGVILIYAAVCIFWIPLTSKILNGRVFTGFVIRLDLIIQDTKEIRHHLQNIWPSDYLRLF